MATTTDQCGRRIDAAAGTVPCTVPTRLRAAAVSAPAVSARKAYCTAGFGIAANGPASASWSFDGRTPMPKITFHPDRWPLHSPS